VGTRNESSDGGRRKTREGREEEKKKVWKEKHGTIVEHVERRRAREWQDSLLRRALP
jgi:hypothetical protein